VTTKIYMSRSIEQQVIGTLLDQTKNSREEESTKNQEENNTLKLTIAS
jgi:hypothetical protein